jgi:hypothetical protein
MPATLTSNLGKRTARADKRAGIVVRKTALDIQAGAAVRSRFRTGDMKRGWATEVLGPHAAKVYNPIDYTIYNERGTFHPARTYKTTRVGPLVVHHVSRAYRIEAQPMLAPAVQDARPNFYRAMRQVYG